MRKMAIAGLCVLMGTLLAQGKDKTVSLPDLTSRSVHLSKLTQTGSKPFHLIAILSELGIKDSEHNAEIEEYWISPEKWRRTIKSSGFSQTLIVNGDKIWDQNDNHYYPFWLRDAVTAIFEIIPESFKPPSMEIRPGPDISRAGAMISREDVEAGLTISNVVSATQCSSWTDRTGTPPAENSVLNTICFGDGRLLTGIATPYFNAAFQEYRGFKERQVARKILVYLEPGTRVEVRITKLDELQHADESLFSISASTPENQRAGSVLIRETEARSLLVNPAKIEWAPVRGGRTTGVLSMMIYVDKQGNVRETVPVSSDNPMIQDQARKAITQWRFKPLQRDGAAVQTEALVTFSFQTTLADAFPILSNAEARKLAASKPDPKFTRTSFAKGTEFTVRASVDERGHLIGVQNIYNVNTGLFNAAQMALNLWIFNPYKINGKPQRFDADIRFRVQ